MGKKYQVIFSYETKLLSKIKVDFRFKANESINEAIDRLLTKTGLHYQTIGTKYFVIHQNTKRGHRKARKLKRKVGQLQKLERKGGIILNNKQKNHSGKFTDIVHSIAELKKEVTITGQVKSENGEPLIGATVHEKETSNGTVTDYDGNYKLSVPENATTLIFSYTGYKKEEVEIVGRNIINVVLVSDTETLSEVVVTAFGMKREEKSLGYSVTKVDGETIRASSETNLVNAIAGRVAGVQISASSGGADASSSIIIRGQNSLRGNNQPLFVIDGVQIDNTPVSIADNFSDSGRDFGNNISDINPEDIESISVLKGPNAAALYGSRAANGVVIITTKKGKKTDGIGLTFSSTFLTEKAYEILPLQNEFGSGEGERFTDGFFGTNDDGIPSLGVAWNNFGPRLDGTTVVGFNGELRPYSPQPNNIADFYQQGHSLINNVSFAGANDEGTSTYRVSFTSRNKKGIIQRNESDKYTLNFRGTQKITDRLSADISVSYNKSEGQGRPIIGNSPLLNRYSGFFPRDLPHDVYRDNYKQGDGSRTGGCPWCFTNSYWEILEKNNIDRSDRLIGTIDLDFILTDWLNLKLKASTDGLERYFENSSFGSQAGGAGTDASFSTNQQVTRQFTYEFLFSASKQLSEDLDLSVNFGGQRWDSKFKSILAYTRNGLRTPGFFAISNSNQDPFGASFFSDRRTNSLYGFGQLGYKNYLFLDFTARNDWSSTLPLRNNSYFYPSASLSFAFTDAFEIESSILTFGKIRASWAQVGNDAQQAYLLNSVYSSTGTFGDIPLASTTTTVPPGNLLPEETNSIVFGFDLRFLRNRIGVDFSWYKNNTTNQIIELDVAESSGARRALINAGEIENTGIDLLLTVKPIRTSNFSWDASFNFAKNKNKVIELNGLESIPLARNNDGPVVVEARPGRPYGDIVTWVPERDANGNIIINESGHYTNNFERQVVGNIQPDWTGGLTNTLTYKGITLSGLIEFSKGGEYYSYTKRWLTARGSSEESLFGRDATHGGIAWTDGSDRTRNDGIIAEGVSKDGLANTIVVSAKDFYNNSYQNNFPEHILDASYIMLRELSLGYSLPKRLLKSTPIQSARISFIGRNLFILSNSSEINNPIAISYGSGNGSRGIEAGAFTPSRIYGFSINVSF
jgi:TonB-linked SusC/RagA family outer membrane protein